MHFEACRLAAAFVTAAAGGVLTFAAATCAANAQQWSCNFGSDDFF
jgi:hypothetical protein